MLSDGEFMMMGFAMAGKVPEGQALFSSRWDG
jgi:hypothetical protein